VPEADVGKWVNYSGASIEDLQHVVISVVMRNR